MIFYKKGEIVKCAACGEKLYYVDGDIDSNDLIVDSIEKLKFIDKQPQIDKEKLVRDAKCHSCGSNFLYQMSRKAIKLEKENKKFISWNRLLDIIKF